MFLFTLREKIFAGTYLANKKCGRKAIFLDE